MNSKDEIIGIIYPLMQSNFNIFKKRRKPLYIKFLTHSKSKNPTKLQKGHYLLLYLSRRNKAIAGYAKIKKVSFRKVFEVQQKYINRIQMGRKEFDEYVFRRESKHLILLELNEIIELKKSVVVDYPITMAGRYVSFDEIKHLLGSEFVE